LYSKDILYSKEQTNANSIRYDTVTIELYDTGTIELYDTDMIELYVIDTVPN
jgi:hypothetical protein